MSSAIDRLRTSYRIRGMSAAREVAKRQHTLFQVGFSAVMGMAEAKGKKLPEIMGVDGKLAAGVAALMFAGSAGPDLAKYLQSAADSLLGQAAFEFGKHYASTPKKVEGVGDADSMDALLTHVAQSAKGI